MERKSVEPMPLHLPLKIYLYIPETTQNCEVSTVSSTFKYMQTNDSIKIQFVKLQTANSAQAC